MWAVLDLYGPVRSVSIVSSTRLEESEGTQPPSPSSDTGSEGEEDDEGEEHGLGVRGCSMACSARGWAVAGPLDARPFLGSLIVGWRLTLRVCANSSGVGRSWHWQPMQLSLFLHTRARMKWVLYPPLSSSWRTTGRISSCLMGTVQPHGWPATIRASLSSTSLWCPSCWSRWALPPCPQLLSLHSDPWPTLLKKGLFGWRKRKQTTWMSFLGFYS